MSFETITIARQIPIINGFVQLPNNLERDRSSLSLAAALATLPNAAIGHLTARTGGARLAGGKMGIQEWLEVCEAVQACCPVCQAAEDLKETLPPGPVDPPPPGEARWNLPDCLCEAFNGFFGTTLDVVIPNDIFNCCGRAPGADLASGHITVTYVGRADSCLWTGTSEAGYGFEISMINDRGSCYWVLAITCLPDVGHDDEVIWYGLKATGSNPVGTYVGTSPPCGIVQVPTIQVNWWVAV